MPHVEALNAPRAQAFSVDPNDVVIIDTPGHPLYQRERNELPVTREQVVAMAMGPPASSLRLRRLEDGKSGVAAGRQRTKSACVANAIGCGEAYRGSLASVKGAIAEFKKDADFVERVTTLMRGRPRRLTAEAANGEIAAVRGMIATENAFVQGESQTAVIRALQEDVNEFEIPIEVAAQRRGLKLSTAKKYLTRDLSRPFKKPSRGIARGPGKTAIRKWFANKEIGADYRTLFGFLVGENTREEALHENPDLKGII